MITKGKLVGDIIDALSQIQSNMETRSGLHLYDINTYCEEFSKELLNLTYGYNLQNLNQSRINEPGLDLGDTGKRVSYQVTATKTSQKVNDTLEKITNEQLKSYDRYIIFILGKKQTSYTINIPVKVSFCDKNDIVDFNDILTDIFSLKLDRLELVHSYVLKEMPKLLDELEIKRVGEEHTQSLYNDLEQMLTPKLKGVASLINFMEREGSLSCETKKKIEESVEDISINLAKIPRLSREFICILFERSEFDTDIDDIAIPLIELSRYLPLSKTAFEDEMSYLNDKGLISFYDKETEMKPVRYICLSGSWCNEYLSSEIKEYLVGNSFDFKGVIVNLDFTPFS
ncbi:SMEK domain-containing protein [Aliivibrio fischeri]|uniref:SMEK domain-containing protein n=1 Tax=Aliivibrio fischeri TaxID=668 RepID=UPI001F3F5C94|nr:SMEK domain-containing protein [Aliivibrio fischeri]MCE7568191.1 SMEK domain-containing protein [Aliivibrio fischeri]